MEFARACVDAGVVVRPFDGDGVRVTVTNATEDDVFLRFAENWEGPRA
jgi:histidinol-phosphate aminotransferase